VQDENFIADLRNYDYVGRKIIDGQECAIILQTQMVAAATMLIAQ